MRWRNGHRLDTTMSAEAQFWLDWWVKVASAVFTLLAVLVALFGNWLRAWLFPPVLQISLANPHGERVEAKIYSTTISAGANYPPEPIKTIETRWYHIRVENRRRLTPATQVQVILLQVEEPNASGTYAARWAGAIPMRWRHMEVDPTTARTIGSPQEVDLLGVSEEKQLGLQPLLTPSPLDKLALRNGSCRMRVVLQARALEKDSNILTVEIAWDGAWHAEPGEMARHLGVTTV
jgi:hypothetical protein